ncbi:MAG: hypothetical protein AAGF12_36450 [Myxococcota bacterium]
MGAVKRLEDRSRDVVEALAAPVAFARLEAKLPDGRYRCRMGGRDVDLPADAAVDPALLEEAIKTGARVLVDAEEGIIAGLLQTQRAVTIDRDGVVDAQVEEFRVSSKRRTLLKAPGAFVDLKSHEVEVYANRVLTRAREAARILATMIKLN